jgi:hypothetical protein
MRENRTYGSVRGGSSNADRLLDSDMSAVYGVGGESDATDIALFFVVLHHPASLSLETSKR